MEQDNLVSHQRKIKRFAQWLTFIGLCIAGGIFIIGSAVAIIVDPNIYRLAVKHFPATVGLPFAALTSLCLVIILESSAGPIEIEGFGIKFKGASGPIILWCMCFFCIASAIKMLW